MTSFTLIERQSELAAACDSLSNSAQIALDTEFMREKTFVPELCLLQLRGDGDPILIDPLPMNDLGPVANLLGSSKEVVLHSCRQDLEALDTCLETGIANLFDTQVAAAFCGYGDQVSYAALVETITGVHLSKAHTRADWRRRPLPSDELAYAADDVRYLHAVRDQLVVELEQSGRMEWFAEECARQLDPDSWRGNPEDAWQRLKGGASLPAEAQETARQLAVWREQRAIDRNRPREWILSSPVLVEISRTAPQSTDALSRIDGVNSSLMRSSAEAIIDICRDSPRESGATPLWLPTRLLAPEERKRVKGIMALLRSTAEQMQLTPSLLANRASVERFVRAGEPGPLFSGWRREVVGERVLNEFS